MTDQPSKKENQPPPFDPASLTLLEKEQAFARAALLIRLVKQELATESTESSVFEHFPPPAGVSYPPRIL